tara:strand:- start:217 stop:654 length:438 start_codon:yes stop_codon:yes gene_type:complete
MYNALSSKVAFDNLEDSLSGALATYPVAAAAVTATANGAAWNRTGAFAEVVPASTITSSIFLDSLVIEQTNTTDTFLIDIATGGAGHEVVIASVRFNILQVNNNGTTIIPIRAKVDANVRISVRCTSAAAAANTANVSIQYRTVS